MIDAPIRRPQSAQPGALDAREIYDHVVDVYAQKCSAKSVPTFWHAILAGGFIGLGALLFLAVLSDAAHSKLLAGVAFSLGLIMILLSGAQLFTGNILGVLSVKWGHLAYGQLFQNWSLVYLGNFVGAALVATLVVGAELISGTMAKTLHAVTLQKLALDPTTALLRGILCNIFVCMAIWISSGAVSIAGKILCIVGPIAAFIAIGLEHSIANLALFSFVAFSGVIEASPAMALNLIVVTLGNVIGAVALAMLFSAGFGQPRSRSVEPVTLSPRPLWSFRDAR